MNLDLFHPEPCENILPYDGHVEDFGLICTAAEAEKSLAYLLENLNWQHDEAKIHGRHYVTARKYAWYADHQAHYIYSGFKHNAEEVWDPFLVRVKNKIEALTKTTFNSCLANLYLDGTQSMGWHSDADDFLGKQPVIASLSFGTTRKFRFKHILTKECLEMNLYSGQLIVMKGDTQIFWQHTIPKMTKIIEPRVNLTFRNIYSETLC